MNKKKEQAGRGKGNPKKYTPGKLMELLNWNKRPFLDKMLEDGEPVTTCVEWCKTNKFSISLTTMYSYIKKRKEAIANGLTMELLEPRNNAESLKESLEKTALAGKKKSAETRKQQTFERKAIMEEFADASEKKRVKHDLELIDEVIQKGFEELKHIERISPAIAIKAIEMKHKLTGGRAGGHTIYGIEEIKLREAARENAIVTIMLKHIPPEKHDEVLEEMEDATHNYYESLGLGEAYRQMEAMND